MPALEQHFLDLAERFCATVSSETGFPTIVCDDTGHIVRSTVAARIGELHAGSLKILRDEANEVIVTPAEAAADPRMPPGVNVPIVMGGRRVGTLGITGPAEAARAVGRIAAALLGELDAMMRAAAGSTLGQLGPRRARVLCVDDSAATRDQLRELLQGDYEVVLARDGVEGLQAARRRPPDVVVSDYDMPRLNGLQLLLAMKGDPALESIPFILSTANTQEKTSARFLDAGAHDFLLKSSGPEELKARVGAAVRAHRTRRSSPDTRAT
jgi:CheY-like chemotaxis protein